MKNTLRNTVLFFVVLCCCIQNSFSQQYQEGKVGVNVGIILAIGTHIDRFGVSINSYYHNNHFQINPELRLYFNGKNLGPNQQSVEGVVSLGVVYNYGKKDTITNDFYSSISNQSQRKNSFGYAYNFYFNDIQTSQKTGTVSIQVSDYNFIAENDLFAQPKLDRYRTGGFLFQYQKENIQLGINTTLFTGEMGQRITDESYPFNHVYENTVGGKYTQFSHGLLSAQLKYVGNYYQTYQANVGIDSEKVRHTVQNRFIHDFIVLPKITKNINAHIPMIDAKGEQYLFKEGQKVKPIKFYFNGFSNSGLFY